MNILLSMITKRLVQGGFKCPTAKNTEQAPWKRFSAKQKISFSNDVSRSLENATYEIEVNVWTDPRGEVCWPLIEGDDKIIN